MGVWRGARRRQKQIERGLHQAPSSREGRMWPWEQTGGEELAVSPIPLRVQTPLRRVWEPQGVPLRARAHRGRATLHLYLWVLEPCWILPQASARPQG